MGEIGGSNPPGTIALSAAAEPHYRKGYPMGDGSRLETGGALTRPCGFNSRSFRWNDSVSLWCLWCKGSIQPCEGLRRRVQIPPNTLEVRSQESGVRSHQDDE
jgi:hypothetical protein